MDGKKQNDTGQNQPTPVNKFVKPDFNNPRRLLGRAFNAPKGMPGGFAPGTFKTQHKG